jgi:hypothetical protein
VVESPHYWRASCVVEVARSASLQAWTPPNKRMHATADTTALKFLRRYGAAGDAGR